MKFLMLLATLIPSITFSQSVVGKWQTIDDNTNEVKAIVEIIERQGKVYGKIVKIFPPAGQDPDPVCKECDPDDPRYNKKIIGMEIISDMKKDNDEYSGGNILDPENGKVYRCKLWLEGQDLKVRGYWGPFFRTQTWKKAL
jgi:uncharacterized protein (DUF2147 family)